MLQSSPRAHLGRDFYVSWVVPRFRPRLTNPISGTPDGSSTGEGEVIASISSALMSGRNGSPIVVTLTTDFFRC